MFNYKKKNSSTFAKRQMKELNNFKDASIGATKREIDIDASIRKEYSVNDELSIHRKAIKVILERFSIPVEEFQQLCDTVANAKVEADSPNDLEHYE